VLLTRSAEDNAEWSARLARQGLTPVVLPCIRTEIVADAELVGRLGAALARADWLVFTSRRGVEALAMLLDVPLPHALRIATVGETTARAAVEILGRADLVGSGATAAALAQALNAAADTDRRTRYVLAVAANASTALEDGLDGARVDRFDVYRTIPAPPQTPKRPFSSLGSAAVFLASPSAVRGFVNQIEMDAEPDVYTIGPTTTAAARAAGLRVRAEAATPNLDGLVEAMQCPS
jgi:uroporphyrinogen-III synthase